MNRAKYELALRLALDNDQFSLNFQPKYNLKEKKIVGVEALIRWNHPDIGPIPPDEFIPIAEEMGVILQIGKWVIEHACQQFSIWQSEGFNDLTMAINLSPHQLIKVDLVGFLKDTLDIYSIPASKIELEITETAIMSQNKISENILTRFHDMGVTLSIDDFGTGYSSLSHIKQLPVDALKIDKSFVSDIPNDKNDIAIVKSVILLSKSLGLHVIAEGIETETQLQFLIEHNCTEGQGYYLSKPLSAEMMTELLKRELGSN
jgi:EAL domain-containing protein (putative c-di-GMP-specific phosphodiesterase class I)